MKCCRDSVETWVGYKLPRGFFLGSLENYSTSYQGLGNLESEHEIRYPEGWLARGLHQDVQEAPSYQGLGNL